MASQSTPARIGGLPRLYRAIRRRVRLQTRDWGKPPLKLHLGSGENLIDGWVNVDFNGPPGTIHYDLTRSFPIPDESVTFIFNEHFIEHITRDQALALLSECRRVLRNGGVIRLSTPDLRKLVDEYAGGRVDEWADMNWKPLTPCRLLNEGMRLWGHQFVYDFDELQLLCKEAGFRSVSRQEWRRSSHPELNGLETRPFHDEIIIEAVR
jgi:predicted SAM-dependent methyltransferase